jgi:hypothetical protein
VGGLAIYPHRQDLAAKKFWQCEPCDAYVGTHKDSPKHAPLGRLANAELRRLKMDVHAAFDPLWKSGQVSRSATYLWLAEAIGVALPECHIGMFDEDRCLRAYKALMGRRPTEMRSP